ncbi:jg631 [Pararge aegeria aegeria]|uniref:Jg631 protein n=1 Tax=Pararge aegeria aegeria TaxID=348720 RepID=A0A8S4QM71_9NEOP|nr:jg631 [Pararge aegeria aegeria]
MGGMLKSIHPADLLAGAAKDALKAGNVAPGAVDTVNIGIVNVRERKMSRAHASIWEMDMRWMLGCLKISSAFSSREIK